MSVGSICSRVVATAVPDETVQMAARRIANNDVGTVVVVEPTGSKGPVGVLTDRDITVRCVAEGLDPETTPVSKVMSKPVQSVDESTSIDETVTRMARASTRRLVVTGDGGTLVGIVSLDDILEMMTDEAGAISRLLERQAPQIPA